MVAASVCVAPGAGLAPFGRAEFSRDGVPGKEVV
jgi:hypothetical protein